MLSSKGARPLSGLDAGFLSLETENAPMAIAGVSILGPRPAAAGRAAGPLGLEEFRDLLRRRLDRAVTFRRRLVERPFDLGRPHWVEIAAEEVDLSAHVERTELPRPAGWHELGELMAWQLAQPLDRGRPLWHFLLVDGVDGIAGVAPGAVALIGRAHHAAIDGVSGAEILGVLFDDPAAGAGAGTTSAASAAAPAIARPRVGERLREAFRDALGRSEEDLGDAPPSGSHLLGRAALGLAAGAVAGLRGKAPPLPYTAPRTPLNRPIGPERSWAPAFLPLDRVKAIKNAADATVNDVILAICAGALRGWLAEREALPAKPLVAMVPVSVRQQAERGAAGNQVSAMLVSLATDVADPWRRLGEIRDAARSSKLAHRALGARTLVESTELLPYAWSGLAARLYTRLHLADRHRPIFNVVITNVPGPPRPLTVAGAPLLVHAGAAPIFDGLGLILVVFSYAGTISVGVTADRRAMADTAAFARRLETGLAELDASRPAAAPER